MAKKKEEVVELPSREELVALAQEVNAVLNLEVAIKFGKKVTDEELTDAIIKECKNNVYEIDFVEDADDATIPVYSEEAKELFEVLGIKVLAGSPPAAGEEVAEEVEEEEVEEEEAPEPVATTKKGANKKDASADDAKAKAAAKKDADDKRKGDAAAKKEAAEPAYSRADALVEILQGKAKKAAMTSKEIIEAVNALYIKNGGTDGIAMCFNVVKYVLPVMAKLGSIEKDGSKYKYIG